MTKGLALTAAQRLALARYQETHPSTARARHQEAVRVLILAFSDNQVWAADALAKHLPDIAVTRQQLGMIARGTHT